MRAVLSEGAAMLCLIACPAVAKGQQAQPPTPITIGGGEVLLVAVTINGEARGSDFLIARQGGQFLVRPKDLARWRIKVPPVPPITIDGESFVPVLALAGVVAQFDPSNQALALTVPPDLFEASRLSPAALSVRPTDSAFAAFLNYDLSLQIGHGAKGAAFLEGGVSDDWGLLAGTMTIGNAALSGGVTRLDTYYLRDNPENLTRLVIGDTITDAPEWSRQVRFGGVRFGTEFSLQPDLITFPTPEFAGRAALPSTVELLVNDVRRFQTDVGQGPFSINQAPLVTGAGDVTLITRDPLGVERRVRSSYYVSSRLLRPGLNAWSVEAGGERADYGLRSFSYRNPFVAGSFRRGISDRLTVGTRAEISGDAQMIGGEADFLLASIAEFGVAAAASRGNHGEGLLYRVFLRRLTPNWNLSVSYERTSRNFDQLGVDEDRDRITHQLQASAGVSLGGWGSLGASYTDLGYADGTRTRIASANYSASIADRGFVNVFALRSKTNAFRTETTLGIGLTIPFGGHSSAYVQADSNNVRGEVRRTPPTEGGFGYRVAASAGDDDRQQAELDWRGDVGEFSVEAARSQGEVQGRLLASGGLLFAGGRAYATRRVENGVGVIEVPGQAGVRIYQENRPVTRTDSRGRAIIPDLRAYEPNRLAIEPGDLPLDVKMPDDTLIVVPRYRGAARATFQTSQQHPAVIVLQMPDGTFVAAGSSVAAGGEKTFTGYGGEIFVEQYRGGMPIEVDTAAGICRATAPVDISKDVLPRIGPLRCRLIGATQ
jgi:outer membrane usher protein